MAKKGLYYTGEIDYIQKAMLHAQPYFCHKSLGYKIKLVYSKWASNYKYYGGHTFRINSNDESQDPNKHKDGVYNHDEVLDLVEKELGGADLMVFLGYDENDFWSNGNYKGGSSGAAYPRTVCTQGLYNSENAKRFKWSINEWSSKGVSATGSVSNVI